MPELPLTQDPIRRTEREVMIQDINGQNPGNGHWSLTQALHLGADHKLDLQGRWLPSVHNEKIERLWDAVQEG